MAGGGGAWKVAYADFVTAMMAFFMVMWIIAQNKPEVKESVAQYFNDPWGTSTTRGRVKSGKPGPDVVTPSGAPSRGAKGVKGMGNGKDQSPSADESADGGASKKPSVMMLHDGNKTYTGVVIPFKDVSSDLDEIGEEKLKSLLPELIGKPFKIELRGHAQARAKTKGENINLWELAYNRAVKTMNYLVQNGVEAKRFRLSTAAAYEPRSVGQDAATRMLQNSRVELIVLNETVEDLTGNKKDRAQRATPADTPPTKPKLPGKKVALSD
jgi:chemotaxis protein MotB